MIVLHLVQLNGSVNYHRKWKLISSEVGVKLKIWKIQNSVKNKIVVQIYWTHVRVSLDSRTGVCPVVIGMLLLC